MAISIAIVIIVLNHVYRPLESYFIGPPNSISTPENSSSLSLDVDRRKNKSISHFLYVFGNLLSQGNHKISFLHLSEF